ncbi:hypothetical protein AOLI_G00042440 [Acnodon oligacanthus]
MLAYSGCALVLQSLISKALHLSTSPPNSSVYPTHVNTCTHQNLAFTESTKSPPSPQQPEKHSPVNQLQPSKRLESCGYRAFSNAIPQPVRVLGPRRKTDISYSMKIKVSYNVVVQIFWSCTT